MNHPDLEIFSHDHVFLSASQESHERRTWIVIALTAIMMVVEVISGIMFGSMALLAHRPGPSGSYDVSCG